jgi:serine/threonine protein phosphatase 1
MSLTYVIPDIHGPDIHGRHDLLEDGLARIAERSAGDVGVILMIGDYVDKGPNSKAVIERLQAGVLPGWRGLALKGNHDAMMVEALRVPAKMPSWMEEAGRDTGVLRWQPWVGAGNPYRLARCIAVDAC